MIRKNSLNIPVMPSIFFVWCLVLPIAALVFSLAMLWFFNGHNGTGNLTEKMINSFLQYYDNNGMREWMRIFLNNYLAVLVIVYFTPIVLWLRYLWQIFRKKETSVTAFEKVILYLFPALFLVRQAINIAVVTDNLSFDIGQALGLQRKTPTTLRSGFLRIIVFIIFLGGLGYTIYSITQGRKFPLPLIIIPFGLIITLFINPTAWHRYLCPWGTFFSLTARFSKFGVKAKTCTGCQACQAQCPTESITYSKTATIIPKNCLLCRKCSTACQNDALKYGRI